MTGAELKSIRRSLGLSTVQMGRALRYQGNDNTVSVAIRLMESQARPIPPWIAGLAYMLGWHGVPARWPDEAQADARRIARRGQPPPVRGRAG